MSRQQADFIRECQRRGIDPSEPIDPKVFDQIRIEIRTYREATVDGGKMVRGRIEKRVGKNQVPLSVALGNLNGCRANTCGSFSVLADGTEACLRCQCHGRDLLNKVGNRREKCPADPPVWNNTVYTALTLSTKNEVP